MFLHIPRHAHVPSCSYCIARGQLDLGLCRPYLDDKGPWTFKNVTSADVTPDVVNLMFETIDSNVAPGRSEMVKQLLCFTLFPLCNPGDQRPLPVCREACEVVTEGPSTFQSSFISLLTSNCGRPMPVGGDLPECIQLQRPGESNGGEEDYGSC